LSISTTCYFYKPTLSDKNAEIEDWLRRLTETHKQWGFGLCFYFLRNKKGFKWNRKRVYRVYREIELNLRIKPKSRIKRDKPEALAVPSDINQVWLMDFISDSLKNGRSIRTFNVLVDWASKEQITLLYIQPGKPTQNAYIERFNRTARQEWLSLNLFEDIEHAQLLATQWQWTYNNVRPHTAIGGVSPRQLL